MVRNPNPWHLRNTCCVLQVCTVVHEIHRVRQAPLRVDVYDEQTASALCEMCLALCDMRAVLVEVVSQLDLVQNRAQLPLAKQQVLAMQVCCTPQLWRFVTLMRWGHCIPPQALSSLHVAWSSCTLHNLWLKHTSSVSYVLAYVVIRWSHCGHVHRCCKSSRP